jgi:plastocyanin
LILVAILGISPQAFAANTNIVMSPGAGSDQSCVAANDCFSPNIVNIAVGDSVTWTNNDKVGHTTTSGQPSDNQTGTVWDSSLVKAGGTYFFRFQNAGDYHYFCMVHPWMTGEIVVGGGGAAPSGVSSVPGGIPLGGSYNAPANMSTPQAPQPAPPSQAPQYGSQAPSASMAGLGQQGGIPLGSSYSGSGVPPASGPVSGGVTYNDSDNPYGPLQGMAWAAGLAIAGVMAGIGAWTAARKH